MFNKPSQSGLKFVKAIIFLLGVRENQGDLVGLHLFHRQGFLQGAQEVVSQVDPELFPQNRRSN